MYKYWNTIKFYFKFKSVLFSINILSEKKNIINNMKISIILLLKRSFKEKIDKNEIDKVQCGQLIQQFIIILVKYLHYIISCKNNFYNVWVYIL